MTFNLADASKTSWLCTQWINLEVSTGLLLTSLLDDFLT